MKITKHKVETFYNGYKVETDYYPTREKAITQEFNSDGGYMVKKYAGTEEINICCESCGKELTEDDEYLKVDEHTRYCSECYEEDTFTTYTNCGEYLSDENNSEIHEIGEELD